MSEPSRKLPPTERGRARRSKILEKAACLFAQKGFNNVSLGEIVKESGGSLATVYQQFGNKTELFFAALSEKIEQIRFILESTQFNTSNAEDDFRSLVELLANNAPRQLFRVAIFETQALTYLRESALTTIERNIHRSVEALLTRIEEDRGVSFKFGVRETTLLLLRYLRGLFLETALDPEHAKERLSEGARSIEQSLILTIGPRKE